MNDYFEQLLETSQEYGRALGLLECAMEELQKIEVENEPTYNVTYREQLVERIKKVLQQQDKKSKEALKSLQETVDGLA